jgi:DNA-binding NtrC family response regulator
MAHTTDVLLVEHDPVDRELVAELVTVRGRGQIRVAQTEDLRGALHWLGQRTFDLILLDTRLPDASALYALRVLGEQAPSTPILPHHSYITPKARQTARERGAFDVVVRGDLNPLWSASNKLLTLRALGGEERPARAVGE